MKTTMSGNTAARKNVPPKIKIASNSRNVRALLVGLESGESFLRDDVAHALRRTAATRMLAVIHQIVPVVEGQLLTRLDVPQRHDPNVSPVEFRFAVRRATVIDETR